MESLNPKSFFPFSQQPATCPLHMYYQILHKILGLIHKLMLQVPCVVVVVDLRDGPKPDVTLVKRISRV